MVHDCLLSTMFTFGAVSPDRKLPRIDGHARHSRTAISKAAVGLRTPR
jgi:hypothetical protein